MSSTAIPIPQDATVGQTSNATAIPQDASVGAPAPKSQGVQPKEQGTLAKIFGVEATPKPHPDYKFDLKASQKAGKPVYQYPQGQQNMDADHPETSTDNAGNVFYKGNKVETRMFYPVPPVVFGAAIPAARTGVQFVGQVGKAVAANLAKKYAGQTAAQVTADIVTKSALAIGAGWLARIGLKGL